MPDESNEPLLDTSWWEENMREVEKDLESLELDNTAFEQNEAEDRKAFDDSLAQMSRFEDAFSDADRQLAEKIKLLAQTPKTDAQLRRDLLRRIDKLIAKTNKSIEKNSKSDRRRT
jgi:hypothetical protein